MSPDFSKYKSDLRIKKVNGRHYIYDPIRRKDLVLQPEEFVRQLVVQYLLQDRGYPFNRIRVEMLLEINTRRKRCDILIFDQEIKPFLLVECKAATVKISQATFDQIARYNLALEVPYLVVTNGLETYCCSMDHENERYDFLGEIPKALVRG